MVNTTTDSTTRFLSVCTLATLPLAALTCAFYGIRLEPSWLDEALSVQASELTLAEVLAPRSGDANPPLYFFLLWGWVKFFGISEFAIRLPSAVSYLCAIFICALTAKEVGLDRRGVLTAAALLAVSRTAIRHAPSARPYALLLLICLFSLLFFFRSFYRKENHKTDVVLYATTVVLGTFTHYWFVFLLLGQGISVLFTKKVEKLVHFSVATIMGLIPFLLFWVPSALPHFQDAADSWLSAPSWTKLTETFSDFLGGGNAGYILLALILTIAFLPIGKRNRLSIDPSKLQSLVVILFCTTVVPFVVSQWIPMFAVGRYTIVALPAFVLLITVTVSFRENPHIIYGLLLLLLIGVSVSLVRHRHRDIPRDDRAVANIIIENANKGDVVICTGLSWAGVDYYLKRYNKGGAYQLIVLPGEMRKHPALLNRKKYSKKPNLLNEEIVKVSQELAASVNEEQQVVLIYAKDLEIGSKIESQLETFLTPKKTFKQKGLFSEKVVFFEKPVH